MGKPPDIFRLSKEFGEAQEIKKNHGKPLVEPVNFSYQYIEFVLCSYLIIKVVEYLSVQEG
jgi:hypothetical protein